MLTLVLHELFVQFTSTSDTEAALLEKIKSPQRTTDNLGINIVYHSMKLGFLGDGCEINIPEF